jgi:hypothetical protein
MHARLEQQGGGQQVEHRQRRQQQQLQQRRPVPALLRGQHTIREVHAAA